MNMILKKGFSLIIALLGLAMPQVATAQEPGSGGWVLLDAESTRLVKAGTNAMYNLRYTEADSIFTQLVTRKPDHPAGYFLLALVDWWRIVPNSSVKSIVDRHATSFDQRLEKVIEISDKRLDENPSDIIGLFFKGSALGYRARLMVLRGFDGASLLEWATFANEGKEAYDIILQCQRLAPSNSDILLGSGLYNYLGAYIPEKYPIAKAAIGFLPPGDRKIGISMLRISGQRAQYAATEARYSLLEVLSLFENDYASAIPLAEELHAQYPGNSVFYRFLARNYYMNHDLLRADSSYIDILRKVERREPGYELTLARQGLYYLGDIRLRRGFYEDAVRFLRQSDELSRRFGEEETGWNTMANLKMGQALDRLNRRDEAIRQYKRVLTMDDSNNAHERAKKYIQNAYQGE